MNEYYNPYSQPTYPYMNGYRNYMPQPTTPNMQTPVQQPQQPQTPIQPQQNMQFILVPNLEVVEKITADKGQTVYMMNQNKPEIYAKAADGFGLQTTKYFRMYEFDPIAESQASQPMQQPIADYTPRDEYNQFVAAVTAEIAAIKQAMTNDTPQTVKPSTAKKTASKEANKETE